MNNQDRLELYRLAYKKAGASDPLARVAAAKKARDARVKTASDPLARVAAAKKARDARLGK